VVNERIRDEITARLERAEAALDALPEGLVPLADYYRAQSLPNLVALLEAQLIDAFPHWQSDEPLRAAGVEWYYDGRSVPEGLGYGYARVEGELRLGEPVGSDSARARDDFDGGLELADLQFGDSFGIDVAAACFPLYECALAGLEPDEDEAWDAIIDAFTLRMFHALHLAAATAFASETFRALTVEMPFYLWANNHDWSPFLLFVLEDVPPGDVGARGGESTDLRVPALAAWLDGVSAIAAAQERKEKLLSSLSGKTPAEWDEVLLGLPRLADADGTLTLDVGDLPSLGWQSLSSPDVYRQVSFDAFEHLFRLVATSEEPGLYDLHYPFTYLFLRDSDRALAIMTELSVADPVLASTIKECAECSLRWAGDSPETRWPNPMLALSESPAARASMQKLL